MGQFGLGPPQRIQDAPLRVLAMRDGHHTGDSNGGEISCDDCLGCLCLSVRNRTSRSEIKNTDRNPHEKRTQGSDSALTFFWLVSE